MQICDLPAFLVAVPQCDVADPDGEIAQAVHALMVSGNLAAALTQVSAIRNIYRREVWFHRLQHESVKRLQQA